MRDKPAMNEATSTPRSHLDSRFATITATQSETYEQINRTLSQLNAEFDLPDHSSLNREHYLWASGRYPVPVLYGSRLWEYPFAILVADLEEGMACADVGCGRTPFTVYLAKVVRADVTGFDPDVYTDIDRTTAFGASVDFARRAGFSVRASGMESLDCPDNVFDRVFCLSVMEHLESRSARAGMREMARILRPGGRMIVTLDVAMHKTFSDADPLSLVWESGLLPAGTLDLAWPRRRLGIGYKDGHPTDVYGLILEKSDYLADVRYGPPGEAIPAIAGWTVPGLRRPRPVDPKPVPLRRRLGMAGRFLLYGNRRGGFGAEESL